MPNKISKLARHATLRQLQVFESIARLKSFTLAAEELNLSQPTVSQQVKKLSNILEAPLFEPSGRRATLTQAGRHLYEASDIILQELSRAEQAILQEQGVSSGHVSFSVISTAQYFVPEVIQQIKELHPDITVGIRVGNRENLHQRIQQNKEDFYLIGEMMADRPLNLIKLAPNPLCFVAHADHPLAGKSLSLSELQSETFLSRETGSGIRNQIDRAFEEAHFTPSSTLVLGGNEAVRLGLLQNLGIAVVSLPTVMNEIESGQLTLLNVHGFPLLRHWYIAHPKDRTLSLAAETVIDLLRQKGEEISQKAFRLIEQSS
jgi:DNA-binding transcriptional LysR family regulator